MDTKLTTEQIVKVLPFDASYKSNLIQILPTLDLERSTAIDAILRELYDSIFQLHYQRNLQLAIDKLPPGINIEDEFCKTIKDQTRLEMERVEYLTTGGPQANLLNVRDQLRQVMSEK